jgi:hypothetical protein
MLKMPTVFGSSVLYHVKELCEDMLSEKKTAACVAFRSTSSYNIEIIVDIDMYK